MLIQNFSWNGQAMQMKQFCILQLPTVKPLNFTRDLISLILQVMKIREIKYPLKFKSYIDSNSKASRFAK